MPSVPPKQLRPLQNLLHPTKHSLGRYFPQAQFELFQLYQFGYRFHFFRHRKSILMLKVCPCSAAKAAPAPWGTLAPSRANPQSAGAAGPGGQQRLWLWNPLPLPGVPQAKRLLPRRGQPVHKTAAPRKKYPRCRLPECTQNRPCPSWRRLEMYP